jgi:hypothetical protein
MIEVKETDRTNERSKNQLLPYGAGDFDDELNKIVEHSYTKKFMARTDLFSDEMRRIEEKARQARR